MAPVYLPRDILSEVYKQATPNVQAKLHILNSKTRSNKTTPAQHRHYGKGTGKLQNLWDELPGKIGALHSRAVLLTTPPLVGRSVEDLYYWDDIKYRVGSLLNFLECTKKAYLKERNSGNVIVPYNGSQNNPISKNCSSGNAFVYRAYVLDRMKDKLWTDKSSGETVTDINTLMDVILGYIKRQYDGVPAKPTHALGRLNRRAAAAANAVAIRAARAVSRAAPR